MLDVVLCHGVSEKVAVGHSVTVCFMINAVYDICIQQALYYRDLHRYCIIQYS